jgi:aminomethyltransferase
MEDRGIPRHGCAVLMGGSEVGHVTSGTISPSLRVGIALASVQKAASSVGISLEVDIRGTRHPARVVKLPFL